MDIQEKIERKYGINIDQENIFKLYKIQDPNLTRQELQNAIDATRKRWQQSINGANEKNAERDRLRLEKADKYEAILQDEKLRKQLYIYYAGDSGSKSSQQGSGFAGDLSFAREYFKFLETSKKINKRDVDFFFKYFVEERKNKKEILKMLQEEFKILILGKEEKYADENVDNDQEGKKKDKSSPLIVNLFQEATVMKLSKCIAFYENARQSGEVVRLFPAIQDNIYVFLNLTAIQTIEEFNQMVSSRGKEIFALRQEKGADFIPLVDLFNTLQALGSYRDVVDNFPEFKLLLAYPDLTPYMYAVRDMKKDTLKELIAIAKKKYPFRDDTDFLLSYYIPVYDNFGIQNNNIHDIIRNAQKKAKTNKVLNKVDEKLGRNKNRLPLGAKIVHFLLYWPIFVVYLLFEICQFVFEILDDFWLLIFGILFVGENVLFPKLFEIDNLLIFRKIPLVNEWFAYLNQYELFNIYNSFEYWVVTLLLIVYYLTIYILPALLGACFIREMVEFLFDCYDWVGYERTFQFIKEQLQQKTKEQLEKNKKKFYKRKIPAIITNVICLFIFLCVASVGVESVKGSAHHKDYSRAIEEQVNENRENKKITQDDPNSAENVNGAVGEGIHLAITANAANIRSGAGVDNSSLMVADKGQIFVATGKQESASNGRIWHEIYLDEEKTKTGWVSDKVVEIKEEQ